MNTEDDDLIDRIVQGGDEVVAKCKRSESSKIVRGPQRDVSSGQIKMNALASMTGLNKAQR
jgi:hypothetical protein